MTQAAKDRKGFLILGAAKGDFSKGRKESTKTGIYWVRPDGFLARMVSSRPSATSSSLSSCKQSWPRRQVSSVCPEQRGTGLVCGGSSHLPPAAASGPAPPCPAGLAASPSAYWSAAPPLLCLSSSLSPKGNKQTNSISREQIPFLSQSRGRDLPHSQHHASLKSVTWAPKPTMWPPPQSPQSPQPPGFQRMQTAVEK